MRRALCSSLLVLLLAGCPGKPSRQGDPADKPGSPPEPQVSEVQGKKVVAPLPAEPAPAPSPRLAAAPKVSELQEKIKSYYAGHVGRRIYLQLDKPLYRPGETIWIRSWDLRARDLSGDHPIAGVQYQLLSPKGAVVLRKQVRQDRGVATNDFVIPQGVQGGEYTLRAIAFDGQQAERPLIVSSYEPPRVKKKLELLRKAYGPGDEVTATIEVKRPTGEPLADQPLTAVVRLDDQELPRVQLTTGATGEGLVRFSLPQQIERGDGLLTVLVSDGGVTESVSKRIPIVLRKVQLSFYPEGGQLVSGLQSRVYFAAKNPLGKPADIEGEVKDSGGQLVAKLRSYHQGMGRFELTPQAGQRYTVTVTRPVGIEEPFPLPQAQASGCVLRSFDDLDGQEQPLRVSVACSAAQQVTVVALLRENLLDAAQVQVPAGKPAIVYLKPADEALARAQGAARVTVFDAQQTPLAERVVYRNRRNLLAVSVEPHKKSYVPREQVALKVTTKNAQGQPIPAELALSVVDDTVISFADDKTGHLLSRLYLEPEVSGEVEEPKVYFDLGEPKAAFATDLLLGTQGYRRFEWQPLLAGQLPVPSSGLRGGGLLGRLNEAIFGEEELRKAGGAPEPQMDEELAQGRAELKAQALPQPAAPPLQPERAARAAAPAAPPPPAGPAGEEPAKVEAVAPAVQAAPARPRPRRRRLLAEDRPLQPPNADPAQRELAQEDDKDWAAAGEDVPDAKRRPQALAWSPVRVFPAPTYSGEYSGTRTDFRETIHWAPRVATGKDGTATVTFYLSDAVTSFRVFSEGVGRGLAGRDETVIKSSLPFSMSVKLPLEVSAGDKLQLPLTLTNETDEELAVAVKASFCELLRLDQGVGDKTLTLGPGKRQSLSYALTVSGSRGSCPVSFAAQAGNLQDEFKREIAVVPEGFPQEIARSGEVDERVSHEILLGEIVPGSVEASVRFFPSPVATMLSGLEALLRQPCGCFEQASSSTYPNVMVMRYLKEHEVKDVKLLARSSQLIEQGYRKLVGYESPTRGYEWFGGDPGHEALSAYGLLEFVDMQAVYGGVDRPMIKRTAAWLMARRDGQGGFRRNPQALDSFGAASPAVTNAYIIYSLVEAGQRGLERELAAQQQQVAAQKDPYLLALAANSLLSSTAHQAGGRAAARRLVGLQAKDGSFSGAEHSITRSTGQNLTVETTALALMALLKAGGHGQAVRLAVKWLTDNRGGYGQWGATQATILAIKALTAYSQASRQTEHPGTLLVSVNGQPAGELSYPAGQSEPIVIGQLGQHFQPGVNTVELVQKGPGGLPYSLQVGYRSNRPASSAQCAVDLATSISRQSLPLGETLRLTATVKNRTAQGQPMTLARVGLPGGLTFQTWQLKELKDKQLIAFYETRPREVILYFRQLKPEEQREIPLELVAVVPGEYTSPASSAYLYYTDEHKTWKDPLRITVKP